MAGPIPVSILTGFLGAGKTTLLNHILTQPHGYKFAIIINEVGEVSIDHELVENQKEEIVQLSNGCICCTIRKDLIRGVQKLLQRGGFDYLLVETTGIADPGPIAQTFLNIPALQQHVSLDSIITVVDAEQVARQLKSTETTGVQIALADFVILNKIDLVDEAGLVAAEQAIRERNPDALIYRADHSKVALNQIIDMQAFDLDQKLAVDPQFLDELRQRTHEDIQSVAFTFDRPAVLEAFEAFLEDLANTEKIFRSKGILWVYQNPRRAVFHGVNNRFNIFWERLWNKEEPRQSRMVFIGRALDTGSLKKKIEQCLVAAQATG